MPKSIKMIIILLLVYTMSYIYIITLKPKEIRTINGVNIVYQKLFYPLRYIDSKKPSYYGDTFGGFKSMYVLCEWINEGNGYAYFIWENMEFRSSYIGDLKKYEDKNITVKFNYILDTYNDFSNHLVPIIIDVK